MTSRIFIFTMALCFVFLTQSVAQRGAGNGFTTGGFESSLIFNSTTGDKISLYGNRLGKANMYGFGIEANTLYYKSYNSHRWYINKNADGGTSAQMILQPDGLHLRKNINIHTSENAALSFNAGDKTGSVGLQDDNNQGIYFHLNGAYRMSINQNGNVAIGQNIATSGYKLAVNGKIRAREVRVTNSGWADFVFQDNYELKPLSEVESFIKTNRHLPDVPSEKEVLDNGTDLGKIDAILLQKIEELTLYMIQLEKENKALKNEMADIKAKLN